ncbi:MAG: hypothetical protein ABIA78_02695 [archaeon]
MDEPERKTFSLKEKIILTSTTASLGLVPLAYSIPQSDYVNHPYISVAKNLISLVAGGFTGAGGFFLGGLIISENRLSQKRENLYDPS